MYRSISNSLSKISKSLNTKNSYQYINTGILSYFNTSPHEQTSSLNILERKSEDCLEFLFDFNCIIKDNIGAAVQTIPIPFKELPPLDPVTKPGGIWPMKWIDVAYVKMRIRDEGETI